MARRRKSIRQYLSMHAWRPICNRLTGKFKLQLTDMAKSCAARLAGIEVPSYEDNESTFPDLQARIAKTVAFLQNVSAEQINGTLKLPVFIRHCAVLRCHWRIEKEYLTGLLLWTWRACPARRVERSSRALLQALE